MAPRAVAFGCALLLFTLLANNAVLSSDPSPARSWGPAEVTNTHSVLEVIFQVNPGDRLTVEVDRSIFQLRLPQIASLDVALYEVSASLGNLDVSRVEPIRAYEGVRVDHPTRGTFFEPAPPTWQAVSGGGWFLYQFTLDHGSYRPPQGDARALWADSIASRLAGNGPFGALASPYQVLPAAASAAQPFFYAAEAAALGLILGGAWFAWRGRSQPATGLEAGVRLADQAVRWLRGLRDLLWIALIGLAALTATVFLLLSGAPFSLRAGIEPDGFYSTWMATTLALSLLVGLGGLVVLLRRVRRAVNHLPRLDLDG